MADNAGLLHNLPAQLSSFVGREVELAEVRALVGGSRLVTVTGAGGAGKARLGLQVAAGLLDGTREGVWLADLAPLSNPELVAVTVAHVLGVRPEPGRPVLDTVVEAVGGRSLLGAGRCAAAGLPEPGAAGHQPRAAGHRWGAGVPGAVDAGTSRR
jgi:hypothetical protein